jgi:hypothetical protein
MREAIMPTFLTIGYGDHEGYERTAPDAREAAHAHDDRLREAGAVMGIAGRPVQVRNHGSSGITSTQGPFMSSPLPVAGFALIEAPTLEDAIELAAATVKSRYPCSTVAPPPVFHPYEG